MLKPDRIENAAAMLVRQRLLLGPGDLPEERGASEIFPPEHSWLLGRRGVETLRNA
jgi:hypothetical protein